MKNEGYFTNSNEAVKFVVREAILNAAFGHPQRNDLWRVGDALALFPKHKSSILKDHGYNHSFMLNDPE